MTAEITNCFRVKDQALGRTIGLRPALSLGQSIAVPSFSGEGTAQDLTVDFIRAPRCEPSRDAVEVVAHYDGEAVLLRAGHHLFSSFHVELSDSPALHRYFAEIAPRREERND